MKAQTMLKFLKHFEEKDLNQMEIRVKLGRKEQEVSFEVGIASLTVECNEGKPNPFNQVSSNLKLLIITD